MQMKDYKHSGAFGFTPEKRNFGQSGQTYGYAFNLLWSFQYFIKLFFLKTRIQAVINILSFLLWDPFISLLLLFDLAFKIFFFPHNFLIKCHGTELCHLSTIKHSTMPLSHSCKCAYTLFSVTLPRSPKPPPIHTESDWGKEGVSREILKETHPSQVRSDNHIWLPSVTCVIWLAAFSLDYL